MAVNPNREKALRDFDRKKVDLETSLDLYLKLIDEGLAVLKRELIDDALGGKARTMTPEAIATMKALGASFNSAADAKIRLDKSAKDRQKSWTKEQWMEAAAKFVLTKMEHGERKKWLLDVIKAHNATRRADQKDGVAEPHLTTMSSVELL
jgi:hypothetical protein